MRLKKRQKILIAIVLIIILALFLFSILNIATFHNLDDLKEARKACLSSNIGNKCSFELKEEKIEGICKTIKFGKVICKPAPSQIN
ncbi:hypothetical protein CMI42_00335 [Candidatus Pacearchaeota archaeon]|nr:hypothetical protein [Candidatus Pacearchaeota archaeon]|tara:strand:- start:26 stop:283 length:258 start_codon:yes stop_codon:yes gene_type:complete